VNSNLTAETTLTLPKANNKNQISKTAPNEAPQIADPKAATPAAPR
jgi:hypothetical protein